VRDLVKDLAEFLAARHPDRLTVEMRKAEREGRLFLDTLRNAYASTAVAPYAVRARPGAPVATPLEWDELDDPALRSNTYTIKTIFDRIAGQGDPWRQIRRRARGLAKPRRRLDKLIARG
jgi:bifunctional non-homologous end joining protein LigD